MAALSGDIITAFAASVLTLAVIVWFFVAQSPAGLQSDERRRDHRPRPHVDTFGPAGPGAEDEYVDRPGSTGPGEPG